MNGFKMGDSAPGQGHGQGQGGAFSYQNGVWLSKRQGARSEMYHKWSDDHIKSQVQKLDKEEHSSMVKLSGQCLEVRKELRGLQQDRRKMTFRQKSSETADSTDSLTSSSAGSSTPFFTGKSLRKSPSASSLTSSSSGYSSLGSTTSARRKSNGVAEIDRGGEGLGLRGKGLAIKCLNPDATALKLKNLHSARALSKLNNNMDIND